MIIISWFFKVIKLVTIISLLNYLTKSLQPLLQSIIDQNYIKDDEKDKNVIPFFGIMFIQKTFIFLLALLAYFIQVLVKRQFINKKNIRKTISPSQIYNSLSPHFNKKLNYKFLIGFSIFIYTYFLSSIQSSIKISTINRWKFKTTFINFLILNLLFINSNILLGVKYFNFKFKVAFVILNSLLFYNLLKSAHFIIFRTELCDYQKETYIDFIDAQEIPNIKIFGAIGFVLIAQFGYFFGIFAIKSTQQNISGLKMLIFMTKFASIFFGMYTLLNMQLLQTIKYVMEYSQGWKNLLTYCIYSFFINLIIAQSIVSYPPSIFLSILSIKSVFHYYFQKTNDQQVNRNYIKILSVLGILGLSIFLNEKLRQKEKKENQQRMNQIKCKQISSSRDSFENNTNENTSCTYISQSKVSKQEKIIN